MKQIVFALAIVSSLSPIIGLLIASFIRKHNSETRRLILLLSLALIADGVMFLFAKRSVPNLFVGNFFLLGQFLLLLSIFDSALQGRNRKLLLSMATIALVLAIVGAFRDFNTHNSLLSTWTSIMGIVLCLIYFYRTLQELPFMEIQKNSTIWIVVASLFYYSGSIILFIVSNYFLKSDLSIHFTLWAFHNILNIIKNGLFAMAIWRNLRNHT